MMHRDFQIIEKELREARKNVFTNEEFFVPLIKVLVKEKCLHPEHLEHLSKMHGMRSEQLLRMFD